VLTRSWTPSAPRYPLGQLRPCRFSHRTAARFELFPVDTHDFHIFWSFLPEAAQALQQAGRFARDTALAAQTG
jgi:hypothetical protein